MSKGTAFAICFVIFVIGCISYSHFLKPSEFGQSSTTTIIRYIGGVGNTRGEVYKNPNGTRKTVIISGVSADYYPGILNMIGSIHFWEPDRQIVVYNLGLNKAQLDELSQICRVTVRWPSGIPSYLPQHIGRLKQYAWKIYAIRDAVDTYGKAFWMDGGSDIRAPLKKLDDELEKDGFFVIGNSVGGLKRLLHQGMYDFFKLKREDFADKDEFQGGYQGYVKGSYGYFNILLPLLKCSGNEMCICPPGSNLGNHRFDQSALSLTVHTSGINMTSRMHYDVEQWQRQYFEKDHTVPSSRFIYTSRRSSKEYLPYLNKLASPVDCQISKNKNEYFCSCNGNVREHMYNSLEDLNT